MPEYVTIKVYAETRKALRLIAAQTGEQMAHVADRLCQEELIRLTPEKTPEETVKRGVKTDKPRSKGK